MTSSLSLLGLIVLVFAVTAIECRAVPDTDTLMPLMVDSMGNPPPLMSFRDKRGHPSRTMMFTGFYRPPRRSGSNSQATSIYTEGNAIGGGAYFSQPVYLGEGPDPVHEGDISSSVAEAHPGAEDEDEEHTNNAAKPQDNEADEDENIPTKKPSKADKKGKNIPMDQNEDEEYDDEDDEEYHRSSKPRGRKQYSRPANNYFPMVFSFGSGSNGRRTSTGSGSGGPITAVANSYSTSKGGVASSVATAYGGMPMKKPRRRYSS